jgi:predicted component of type VI protein secretion system
MAERPRSPRTLMVADHLWDALAAMAADMGTDREALVNQALYTFARLNGFVLPAEVKSAPSPSPASHAMETPLVARPVSAEVVEEVQVPTPLHSAPLADKAAQKTPRVPIPDLGDLDPDTPPRPAAAAPAAAAEPRPRAEAPAEAKVLVLMSEGRELDRVTKDRFLIGRGKHCDLVINSGKVSREHAAIVRENGAYFIEDLGSSNGTWFEKRRIGRRQIHDGDDYFICAEKLSCTFR